MLRIIRVGLKIYICIFFLPLRLFPLKSIFYLHFALKVLIDLRVFLHFSPLITLTHIPTRSVPQNLKLKFFQIQSFDPHHVGFMHPVPSNLAYKQEIWSLKNGWAITDGIYYIFP